MRRTKAKVTVLDVVEGVYAGLAGSSPSAWLAEALALVEGYVGEDLGGIAHAYDVSGPPASWTFSRPVVHGKDASLGNAVLESFAMLPPRVLERCYREAGPAGTFSRLTGMTVADLPSAKESVASARDIADQLYVNAQNPDDRGMIVVVNVAKRRPFGAESVRKLAQVAAHLAAAQRIAMGVRKLEAPAAVLEADGKLADVDRAHEGAIELLRRAVVKLDRARATASRRHADEVVAEWTALLAGRYSLVDRHESDGRR